MASSSRISCYSIINPSAVGSSISAIHPDILITHILSRLDGWSLTLLSSTSSNLHSLASEQTLWRDVCLSLWPCVQHPRLQDLIPSFPNGYHGFFSDSFPVLTGNLINLDHHHRHDCCSFPQELISAIDIRYNHRPILSRLHQEIMTHNTATSHPHHLSSSPSSSPFQIQILNPKETHRLPIKSDDHGALQRELEEKLELSWIIIDPTTKNRAVNISSLRPVSVQRQWITGKVEVKYSTVVVINSRWWSGRVELAVGITCNDGEGQGHLHMEQVWMQVEDVQGNCLKMKETVEVVTSLVKYGERKRRRESTSEEKNNYSGRYREYVEKKREWRESEQRNKKMKTHVGCLTLIVLTICAALYCFMH